MFWNSQAKFFLKPEVTGPAHIQMQSQLGGRDVLLCLNTLGDTGERITQTNLTQT